MAVLSPPPIADLHDLICTCIFLYPSYARWCQCLIVVGYTGLLHLWTLWNRLFEWILYLLLLSSFPSTEASAFWHKQTIAYDGWRPDMTYMTYMWSCCQGKSLWAWQKKSPKNPQGEHDSAWLRRWLARADCVANCLFRMSFPMLLFFCLLDSVSLFRAFHGPSSNPWYMIGQRHDMTQVQYLPDSGWT